MRVERNFGAALMLVLCAASGVLGHDETSFDKRRATPGIKLELIEVAGPPEGTVAYRGRATGAPRDVEFELWGRDWDSSSSYREIASGVRIDEAGMLVADGQADRRPGPIAVSPGAYPRGAVWEIVLVSVDKKITAFATIVPRPIRVTDGACAVSLQLASWRGDRFLALATGFTPGEDVTIQSQSAGRTTSKRGRAAADGQLAADLITHVASDARRDARYIVKGRSCEVAVDYSWGEAALLRR